MKSYLSIILLVLIILAAGIIPVYSEKNISNDYTTYLLNDYYFGIKFNNNEEAILFMPDGSRELLYRKVSASGARYANEAVIFWNKGNHAQIIFNEIIIDMVKIDNIPEGVENNTRGQNINNITYFKNEGVYLIVWELDSKAQLIFSGEEFDLKERIAEANLYDGDNINVRKEKDHLKVEVNNYSFRADRVKFNDFLNNNNLKLKGLGQEPGWLLEIIKEEIELQLDYAQVKLNIANSQYDRKIKQNKIIYDVRTSLVNFQIEIAKEIHTDIMSGKKFPYTIEINAPNREIIGGGFFIKE